MCSRALTILVLLEQVLGHGLGVGGQHGRLLLRQLLSKRATVKLV